MKEKVYLAEKKKLEQKKYIKLKERQQKEIMKLKEDIYDDISSEEE